MSNEIERFNGAAMTVMQDMAEALKLKKEIEKREKAAKARLLDLMTEYDVKSVDNDVMRITRVEASESTALDVKALERREPELYADLMKDYPKTTKRAASIRITVK